MEIEEGFHGKKESRRERWINATGITLSDGALPKSNVTAQVKVAGRTMSQETDRFGRLPHIPHISPGEKVEVFLPSASGVLTKQFEFALGTESQSFILFNDYEQFSASTKPKKASQPESQVRRDPIRYVVQPGDTVGGLAKRFTCTIDSIKRFNPHIRNINRIYEGQVLGIYGPASNLIPQKSARAVLSQAPTVRSKEGIEEPLSIVKIDQKQAPWMIIALDEAKKWSGKAEGIITKSRNYHTEIGGVGNLVNVPWCASFVNFCLKNQAHFG